MTNAQRTEFRADIRKYMETGKLTDELFGDMALLYSGLLDDHDESRLKKYEGDIPGKGWSEIFQEIRA